MGEERKQPEKENEKLKQALAEVEYAYQEQTKYIAQASRSVRIPMNTIGGMTAIARDNIDNKDKVLECLDKIDLSGQRLMEIVNEVTVMAEWNDYDVVLAEIPFRLKEIMKRVLGGFSGQIMRKNLTVQMQEIDVLHERLVGDRVKIEQILTNLLSNAVRYTPSGGDIAITVREMHSFQGYYSLFRFEIEDTGIGMSEEFMQKMYRPFERAGDFRVGDEPGLGLGLTIARRAVRMMSGDMTIVSEPEKGTKVTVTLHIKRRVDQDTEGTGKSSSGSLAGKRMLVAEDNELNAEMIKELLRPNGVIIDVVENGLKALDMLETREVKYYDCVLMDIRMPVMNGYEATRRIRKNKRGDLQRIPIIAMTADAYSSDVKKSKDVGMDAHISKPFGVRDLMEVFTHIF